MAEEEGSKTSWRCVAGTFYAFISAAFTIYLVVTLITRPLFPIRSDSAEWSSSWLLLAVLDYYHMAACFCGIVIATETRIASTIWCLLILLLGAPFATLYTAKQIGIANTLTLREDYVAVTAYSVHKPEKPLAGFVGYIVAASYVLIGGGFAAQLVLTIIHYPLTSLATDDAEWAYSWFVTTVLDFYTIAVCMIGIILSTDDMCPGLAWSIGILVITGPPGSAWMAQRLLRGRPLALE
ncbi:Hypothetical protein (Fragment) [Durusdinium trenchii]|uniref:Uncharacterized protein n=1 Tax=Durusdinium trenchii TaxID=1381693 RepID=A0ABP0JJ07_9DINO